MKYRYLLLVLLFFQVDIRAQDLAPETEGLRKDPEWVKMYQSKGFLTTSMDMDAEHNLYTAGTFQSYLSYGDSNVAYIEKGYRQSFPNHVFLQKHSLKGDLKWTVYADGMARLHDLKVEAGGSVLITGEVWSAAMVFTSSDGRRDSLKKDGEYDHGSYIARFSAEGILLQAHYYGRFTNDNAQSIALAPDGSVILAGNYMHRKDSELLRNWLLMSLNPDLSLKWLQAGDSLKRSAIRDVVVDRKGRITVVGWYTEHLKVGAELLESKSSGQLEWLAQFEEDGELCWLNHNIYRVDSPVWGVVINELSLDTWGRVLITGGNQPFFVVGRLKRNGSIDWLRKTAGRSSYSYGMRRKADGNILAYGHGYGSSFESRDEEGAMAYQSKGSTDFLCVEYSRKGELENMLVGGGLATDYLTAVFWHEGKLYALGHDLGGPAIVFGDQSLPKGYPKMWLACWDWP